MGFFSDWLGAPEDWSKDKLMREIAHQTSVSIHDSDEAKRKQADEQCQLLLRIFLKREGKL